MTFFCTPDRLRIHPENMRRYYPPQAIEDMAGSIRASQGVWQALLVVPDPERDDAYLVVDGNLRLAAGRALGDDCPPLKCEPIEADRAAQLLVMATTSAFHYPKDPISEALHYRRLVEQGYDERRIAAHTGLNPATVKSRLRLLDLEEDIQELIAAGRLPRDRRVADALLSVPDVEARVKLARRMGRPGISIKAIERACARLVDELARLEAVQDAGAPMLGLARHRTNGTAPPERATWDDLRDAARGMCAACDIQQEVLDGLPEPAWTLVSHQAGACCERCPVRGVQAACESCPGVELLTRLVEAARGS